MMWEKFQIDRSIAMHKQHLHACTGEDKDKATERDNVNGNRNWIYLDKWIYDHSDPTEGISQQTMRQK